MRVANLCPLTPFEAMIQRLFGQVVTTTAGLVTGSCGAEGQRGISEPAIPFAEPCEGSALVDFAVLLPVLVLIFIGVVDYTLFLQQEMQVTEAAAAGATYGAIPGNQKDFTGMQTAARNAAPGISGFAVTAVDIFTCTPGGTAVTSATICAGYGTPIEYVQVQTSATSPPLLSYAGMSSLNLKGSATVRVPWTP
jgi:Flp pilus assembly protein TadG